MNDEVLFMAREDKIVFYKNGRYEERNEKGEVVMGGSYAEFYDIVSVQFNQLKAKIYNTLEASITNETQLNAAKGLIKGFCNDNYKNVITDLEGLFQRIGIHSEGVGRSFQSIVAEPLEQK